MIRSACVFLCLALLTAAPACAVSGANRDDVPPKPNDADPGDLPVPDDSTRWATMRETYSKRLREMQAKENEDTVWDQPPVSPARKGPVMDPLIERTDTAYPMLSFRFGLIRTGPALEASMAILQTKKGRAASKDVVEILRTAVKQMKLAEADPELQVRLAEGRGGTFSGKNDPLAPRNTGQLAGSPAPGASPAPKASPAPEPRDTFSGAGPSEEDFKKGGLPDPKEPLGALLRPAATDQPKGVGTPPIVGGAPPASLQPGNQAAATIEALSFAETFPENTSKLREVIAGAERNASPIVLDLDGNGEADTTTAKAGTPEAGSFQAAGAVYFDVAGRGQSRLTEWLEPNRDGLLVFDANGNGLADGASELFGDTDGFADGYAKMALLDANRDGSLSGDELTHLYAWIDDGDGACEAGEMKRLSDLSITRLSTHHVKYASSFERGGRTYKMWDWFPHWE